MEDLIASGSKQHLGVPLGFGDASSRRDLLVLGPMRQRPTRAALPLSASPPQATFFPRRVAPVPEGRLRKALGFTDLAHQRGMSVMSPT